MRLFKIINAVLILCAHFITTSANTKADEALLQACMAPGGDQETFVDVAKQALKDGANINVISEGSGQTPLMAAVLRGKTKIVKYLLENGADPNIPERDGYLPPHGAAFQGRADIMKLLINAGIDVNVYHGDGYLPLHRACWGRTKGHAETLRVLLEHGIPYDIQSKNLKTCKDMAKGLDILKVLEEENRKRVLSDIDEGTYNDDDDDDEDDDEDDDYDDDDGHYGDGYYDDDADDDYEPTSSREEL